MARRSRGSVNSIESISPAAAKAVLLRLVHDGRVSAAEVTSHVMDEVESLRSRLEEFMGHVTTAVRRGPRRAASAASSAAPVARKRAKKAVSAARREAMALQGQFLAALRQMPSTQARERFKKAYKAATSRTEKEKLIRDAAK